MVILYIYSTYWCIKLVFYELQQHYAELLFFHLLGSVGHVVHSATSRARNADALFSMLGGPSAVCKKSATGHVMPNLCFCICWDLWFM
jgi:hypothetical protein